MKRIFSILALLILALPLAAQTTSVTATIQDSASVAWGNANFQITWVGQGNPSTTSGQSFPLTVSGTANGSGVMSATVTDVAFIVPTNSTWKVCITSAVSSPNTYCTNVAITGASQDISAQITAALIPPSVTGGPLATAYADSEVAAVFGNQYARLSDNTFRCYTTSWGSCQGSGGGTGTVTSVSVTTANGVSGTVATATTTPAISLTLGAITPTSIDNSPIGATTPSTGKFTTLTSNGTTAFNAVTDGSIAIGSGAASSNYFSFSGGRAFIGNLSGANYVIQAPGSKTIVIQTGSSSTFGSGTNSMAFDASQNVGIGSGNASATLDSVYWDANGVKHENGTVPVVTGTGCTLANGTNAGGAITTSSATACTVTFSHSGWATWAACTVSASLSTSLPYVSSQSKTAAIFTEVSSTGTLYYACNGN